MDRWLGDGGMPLIEQLGGRFTGYGDGWVIAEWAPRDLACNPHGIVQAGVHAVVLDAAMNFAVNANLDGRDRSQATLELKSEIMRAARVGDALTVRGEVARLARQIAFCEARVSDGEGRLVSRATGTFLIHREG